MSHLKFPLQKTTHLYRIMFYWNTPQRRSNTHYDSSHVASRWQCHLWVKMWIKTRNSVVESSSFEWKDNTPEIKLHLLRKASLQFEAEALWCVNQMFDRPEYNKAKQTPSSLVLSKSSLHFISASLCACYILVLVNYVMMHQIWTSDWILSPTATDNPLYYHPLNSCARGKCLNCTDYYGRARNLVIWKIKLGHILTNSVCILNMWVDEGENNFTQSL